MTHTAKDKVVEGATAGKGSKLNLNVNYTNVFVIHTAKDKVAEAASAGK